MPDVRSEVTALEFEPLAAEAYHDFVSSGPPASRAAVGARAARIGGGVATSVPGDPTGAWTRVMGVGLTAPLTTRVFDDLRRFYARDGETTVTVTLAPCALPDDWETVCASQGLAALPGGHKLVLDLDAPVRRPPVLRPASTLRVTTVTSTSPAAQQLGELMTDGFGMGTGFLSAMVAGVLHRDEWRGFGAWTDTELVAGALLRISGGWAHLIGAVTRTDARRRGAQTALTSARLRAAREAGCRWAVVEIDGDPEGRSTSLHNLRSAGFEVISPYPSFSWSPWR